MVCRPYCTFTRWLYICPKMGLLLHPYVSFFADDPALTSFRAISLTCCPCVVRSRCTDTSTSTWPPEPVGSVGPWPDQNFGRVLLCRLIVIPVVGWMAKSYIRLLKRGLKRSQCVPPCLRARTSSVCRQMRVRALQLTPNFDDMSATHHFYSAQ